MTEQERALIFEVAAGDAENLPLIHSIHTSFKRGVEMLEACRRDRLVGNSFKQMWKDNGGSKMRVGSYLLKKLNRDNVRKLHIKDLK